jgi:hypothetical protein
MFPAVREQFFQRRVKMQRFQWLYELRVFGITPAKVVLSQQQLTKLKI